MADHLPAYQHTEDPDLVAYTLQMVVSLVPGFSPDLARQIEDDVKDKFGGRRHFLPKGAKRLTPEQRAAVFKDGLTSLPTGEITKKHQISRSTLYVIMKTGGGRFS